VWVVCVCLCVWCVYGACVCVICVYGVDVCGVCDMCDVRVCV